MTRIRVVVTAEDIAAGRRHSYSRCPLARAVRRATPARPVRVFGGPLGLDIGHEYLSLGRRAIRFVSDFDRGLSVQPATFYLEGPDR